MAGGSLRVLHVVSGDLYAGAERVVEELAIAQQAVPDVRVTVAVMNEGLLAERLCASGIRTVVLDERRLGTFSLLSALRGLVRQDRAQVVHTHRFKENVLGALAATGLARSLRTVHGAPEFRRSGAIRDRAIAVLDTFSARWLQERIVCVSSQLREQLGGTYGSRECDCVVNGIDRSRLLEAASAPVPLLAGRLNIGVFARLVPVKRVDVAIQVTARVRRELGAGVMLHVFGDGPLKAELQRQAADPREIMFHGSTPHAPSFMRRMHALLVTSAHEGLPVSVLEAMGLGVPVVATNTGGLPELLDGGRCGWLVNADDIDGYARALVEALTPGSLQEARRERAIARIDSVFSARRMAAQYLDIYRAMTARRGVPP